MLEGVWQDAEVPGFFLEMKGRQILIASGGRIREAATVLRPVEGGLLVCEAGYETRLQIRRAGETVELFDLKDGRLRQLVKVASKPDALSLSLALPEPSALPEDKILSVQREIRLRFENDQSAYRQRVRGRTGAPTWLEGPSTAPGEQQRGIDFLAIERAGDNAEYMREIIQEIGWIDTKRFGYPASSAAFFLVQHSWDLPLMLSILPRIREDVEAGLMDGDSYALLYDRSQLALGRLQRFGSQVAKNSAGEWIVLPLEEPDRVDVRRKEWGLQPLKDYVGVFGASEVRLSTDCAALSAQGNLPSP